MEKERVGAQLGDHPLHVVDADAVVQRYCADVREEHRLRRDRAHVEGVHERRIFDQRAPAAEAHRDAARLGSLG